jgi:hypothetical protein
VNSKILQDSADNIVRHIAAQPVERRVSLVEELVRVDGDLIILTGDEVCAGEQNAPGSPLDQIESRRYHDLNTGGLAGGRVENRWNRRDRVDAAVQYGIRFTRVVDYAEAGPGKKFAAYLLGQHVHEFVTGRESGESGYRNRLNALRHQIGAAANVIAAGDLREGKRAECQENEGPIAH